MNAFRDGPAREVHDTLVAAGWTTQPGYEMLGLADLSHDNGRVEIEAEYIQESASIRITIYRRLVDIDIRVQVADCLQPFLQLLVAEQDRLDEDNWDGFLRKVLTVCPDVVALSTDEDGNVTGKPLSAD